MDGTSAICSQNSLRGKSKTHTPPVTVDGTAGGMDDDHDDLVRDDGTDTDGEPAVWRPLDIARILDGLDADDALDDCESTQDAAEERFEPQDDADDNQDGTERSAALGGPFRAWKIILATRDDAGQWQTVGEPVTDARFDSMALAHDFAEARNKREFGHRFDWALDPRKAWLAVREGQRGRLRLHEPAAVTAVCSQPTAPLRCAEC